MANWWKNTPRSKSLTDQILAELAKVKGPGGKADLVSLGMVSQPVVDDEGAAFISLTISPEQASDMEPVRDAAEKAVLGIENITKAYVVLTAEKPAGEGMATNQRTMGSAQAANSPVSAPSPLKSAAPVTPAAPTAPQSGPAKRGQLSEKKAIAGIKSIIAVASGKGGVGKSTVTCNLAMAFNAAGLKIGILDADIYGPSLPRLMNIKEKPRFAEGRKMHPLNAYGVKLMSMGFLVDEDAPIVWRGPMVMSALTQMLREVIWGDLDILIVDMPPGTGDAQLTLAQNVPLAGAVIVSTPQDLALIDARKGLNMFRRVDVPVLGIVENMSYFECSHCGTRHEIFSHGGARTHSRGVGVPFLGEIPLQMSIREASDSGRPLILDDGAGPVPAIFQSIAGNLMESLEIGAGTIPA